MDRPLMEASPRSERWQVSRPNCSSVKATVTGAGDALPNGVSVKVSATTEKEDNKMLIPFDSLYFSGGDAYVYCVEDNKLVRTSVTVGLMDDEHAVIEDGLDN